MKYKLIKDLPDIEKGALFQPSADNTIWYGRNKQGIMFVYTDKQIKDTAWFKAVKDIEDKISDTVLTNPIKTIGKDK